MSRKEALRVQKEANSIHIEQVKEFYEYMPKSKRKEELKYLKPMLEDKVFFRTGIELAHLDIVWGLLKL